MSRGHVAATHDRSVYPDRRNCAICASQVTKRVPTASEDLLSQGASLLGWAAVASFVLLVVVLIGYGIIHVFS